MRARSLKTYVYILRFLFILICYESLLANEKPCENTFRANNAMNPKKDLVRPAINDYREILNKIAGEEEILYGRKLTNRYTPLDKNIVRSYLILTLLDYEYSLDSIFLEYMHQKIPLSELLQTESEVSELRSDSFFLTNQIVKLFKSKGIPQDVNSSLNIVVEKKGASSNQGIIELSAHYDTVASYTSGADNNGTGITTLLQTMKTIKFFHGKNTVRGIFTDNGEKNFMGSKMHQAISLSDKEKVLGAIVLDTIGYFPTQFKDKPSYSVEAMKSNDEQNQWFLNSVNSENTIDEIFTTSKMITDKTYPETAEHGIYWKHKIPAVLISEDLGANLINPTVNTSLDRVDKINWSFYESVSNQVIDMTIRLSMTEYHSSSEKKDPTTNRTELTSSSNKLSDLKRTAFANLKLNLDLLLKKSQSRYQRIFSKNLDPLFFKVVDKENNILHILETSNYSHSNQFDNALDMSLEFFHKPIPAIRIGTMVILNSSPGVIEIQSYRNFRYKFNLTESLVIFDNLSNIYELKGLATLNKFFESFSQITSENQNYLKIIELCRSYLTDLHSNSATSNSSFLELEWPNFPLNPESFKVIRNNSGKGINSTEDYKL